MKSTFGQIIDVDVSTERSGTCVVNQNLWAKSGDESEHTVATKCPSWTSHSLSQLFKLLSNVDIFEGNFRIFVYFVAGISGFLVVYSIDIIRKQCEYIIP